MQEIPNDSKILAKIDFTENQYFIINSFEDKLNSDTTWLSVRYIKNKQKKIVK